jgi:trehalose-6-phosphate synthase
MKKNNTYYTKLTFKGRYFDVGIRPVGSDGYDIEVRVKGPLSGDDFQALRQYLDQEGYLEAARDYFGDDDYLKGETVYA